MARFIIDLPDTNRHDRKIDSVTLAMVLRGTATFSGVVNFRDIQISEVGKVLNVKSLLGEGSRKALVVSPQTDEEKYYVAMTRRSR